jgi:hypothetical protein
MQTIELNLNSETYYRTEHFEQVYFDSLWPQTWHCTRDQGGIKGRAGSHPQNDSRLLHWATYVVKSRLEKSSRDSNNNQNKANSKSYDISSSSSVSDKTSFDLNCFFRGPPTASSSSSSRITRFLGPRYFESKNRSRWIPIGV